MDRNDNIEAVPILDSNIDAVERENIMNPFDFEADPMYDLEFLLDRGEVTEELSNQSARLSIYNLL